MDEENKKRIPAFKEFFNLMMKRGLSKKHPKKSLINLHKDIQKAERIKQIKDSLKLLDKQKAEKDKLNGLQKD